MKTRVSAIQNDSNVCADIVGFDFSGYDDADIAAVRSYWLQYGVIRFRATDITDQQQVDFSRHFGDFVIHPKQLQEGGHPIHREILVISNVMKDGKPSGALGNSEATWHTDTWFYERPPAGAILRAIEVPPSGGDTYFLSTYQAFETLPEELRRAVEGGRSSSRMSTTRRANCASGKANRRARIFASGVASSIRWSELIARRAAKRFILVGRRKARGSSACRSMKAMT